MALKVKNGFSSFDTWEKDERRRDTLSDEKIAALQDECDFWRFLQFEFYRELTALKDYAKSKNVALIGDIPIYVAYDSADVWAHPEIFRLDKNMRPKEVAGVPPDYFSADGQLWGNPLYDWKNSSRTAFCGGITACCISCNFSTKSASTTSARLKATTPCRMVQRPQKSAGG